jgi:hypothetical protein
MISKNSQSQKPPGSTKPKITKRLQTNPKVGVYFTEAKVKSSTYPMELALTEITARLTGFVAEREKPAKDAQRGAISSLQEVIVTRNDAPTTLSAIKKRLDVVPQDQVGQYFKLGYEELIKQTPVLPEIRGDEQLVEAWLLTLNPDKQAACRDALSKHIHAQGMQDREIFAKAETLLKPEGSAARLIHNGNPTVAVVMGAITNELQRRAKMILAESNPVVAQQPSLNCAYFPSGQDDKEIAQLRERATQGEGFIIEGDFKSNDATQPADLRKYEATWYRKMGAPDWYARECLELMHMNVFSRSLGMKFAIKGQRHSGEEAGTIGNTFNTTCLMLGALASLSLKGCRCLVYGDDSLLWVPTNDWNRQYKTRNPQFVAKRMQESANQHGMDMEVSLPSKTDATFLQCRTHVTAGGNAVPFPKLGRYLSKVNVRPNFNPNVGDDDYYAGKYLGLAHQYRFFPSISRKFLATSQALSSTPHVELKHKAWKPIQDPAVLVTSVLDVKRALDSAEESKAFSNVYGMTSKDVHRAVDITCASQLLAAHSRDPRKYSQLQTTAKKLFGTLPSAHGIHDLDSPSMAVLIKRDNQPHLLDFSRIPPTE